MLRSATDRKGRQVLLVAALIGLPTFAVAGDQLTLSGEQAARERQLELDQGTYRFRLGPRELERARRMQDQFHREWLDGRRGEGTRWLEDRGREAPSGTTPPTAGSSTWTLRPADPRATGPSALEGQLRQEAVEQRQLHQRQAAEQATLERRARTIGLPPGAAVRQRQGFATEEAMQQLQLEMLRPGR